MIIIWAPQIREEHRRTVEEERRFHEAESRRRKDERLRTAEDEALEAMEAAVSGNAPLRQSGDYQRYIPQVGLGRFWGLQDTYLR